jgi:hypothetical protein
VPEQDREYRDTLNEFLAAGWVLHPVKNSIAHQAERLIRLQQFQSGDAVLRLGTSVVQHGKSVIGNLKTQPGMVECLCNALIDRVNTVGVREKIVWIRSALGSRPASADQADQSIKVFTEFFPDIADLIRLLAELGAIDRVMRIVHDLVIHPIHRVEAVDIAIAGRLLLETRNSLLLISEFLDTAAIYVTNDIQTILFISSGAIVLDTGIGNAGFSGRNIVVVAKTLQVPQDVAFDLSAVNGANAPAMAAESSTVYDQPGEQGQSGGAGSDGGRGGNAGFGSLAGDVHLFGEAKGADHITVSAHNGKHGAVGSGGKGGEKGAGGAGGHHGALVVYESVGRNFSFHQYYFGNYWCDPSGQMHVDHGTKFDEVLKRPDGIAGSERKLGELEKYSRSIDDQLEGQTRWTAVGKTIMSTAPCVFSCLCKILDTKKDFEAKIAEIDQAIKLEGEVIKK